jgi:hypothetical protein
MLFHLGSLCDFYFVICFAITVKLLAQSAYGVSGSLRVCFKHRHNVVTLDFRGGVYDVDFVVPLSVESGSQGPHVDVGRLRWRLVLQHSKGGQGRVGYFGYAF